MNKITGLFGRLNLVPPCLRNSSDVTSPGATNLTDCIQGSLSYWIGLLLFIAAVVSMAYVFYGAFQMVTAYGNEAKYASGKTTVFYALIGIAISVLALVIINFFVHILGGQTVTIPASP